MYRGVPNMNATQWPKWYDLDAWTRVCSGLTQTPNLPLTLIWLRRLDPNLHRYDFRISRYDWFFWSLFLSVSQSQVCRIEKRQHHFFGASVISVQNFVLKVYIVITFKVFADFRFESPISIDFQSEILALLPPKSAKTLVESLCRLWR